MDEDPQIQIFHELKRKLNQVDDLSEMAPLDFLVPFLEVIQSEDLLGPITGYALSTVNKFLSYGLIDLAHHQSAEVVERLAESVTRARFRGTVPANDEVVLMKIIQVLRTLVLTPIGTLLTNETVREIMVSCFRICFQMVFTELLRKTAEHTLVDIVQLLFSRLNQYREDVPQPVEKLESRKKGVWMNELFKGKRKTSERRSRLNSKSSPPAEPEVKPEAKLEKTESVSISEEPTEMITEADLEGETEQEGPDSVMEEEPVAREYNMSTGVVGTTEIMPDDIVERPVETDSINQPYGLPLVVDLLSFLSSLIDQHERQNADLMIKTGLSLIMVALEVARDTISDIPELLDIVKNDMSKNLFQLLSCDKLSLVSASLRVSLLLFESLRPHLKYQQEEYLKKMIEIIKDDQNPNHTYELKELLLENLVQFFHLPGMATELYLNYDCDSHCSNMYEDITKLLSKQEQVQTPPISGLPATLF